MDQPVCPFPPSALLARAPAGVSLHNLLRDNLTALDLLARLLNLGIHFRQRQRSLDHDLLFLQRDVIARDACSSGVSSRREGERETDLRSS